MTSRLTAVRLSRFRRWARCSLIHVDLARAGAVRSVPNAFRHGTGPGTIADVAGFVACDDAAVRVPIPGGLVRDVDL